MQARAWQGAALLVLLQGCATERAPKPSEADLEAAVQTAWALTAEAVDAQEAQYRRSLAGGCVMAPLERTPPAGLRSVHRADGTAANSWAGCYRPDPEQRLSAGGAWTAHQCEQACLQDEDCSFAFFHERGGLSRASTVAGAAEGASCFLFKACTDAPYASGAEEQEYAHVAWQASGKECSPLTGEEGGQCRSWDVSGTSLGGDSDVQRALQQGRFAKTYQTGVANGGLEPALPALAAAKALELWGLGPAHARRLNAGALGHDGRRGLSAAQLHEACVEPLEQMDPAFVDRGEAGPTTTPAGTRLFLGCARAAAQACLLAACVDQFAERLEHACSALAPAAPKADCPLPANALGRCMELASQHQFFRPDDLGHLRDFRGEEGLFAADWQGRSSSLGSLLEQPTGQRQRRERERRDRLRAEQAAKHGMGPRTRSAPAGLEMDPAADGLFAGLNVKQTKAAPPEDMFSGMHILGPGEKASDLFAGLNVKQTKAAPDMFSGMHVLGPDKELDDFFARSDAPLRTRSAPPGPVAEVDAASAARARRMRERKQRLKQQRLPKTASVPDLRLAPVLEERSRENLETLPVERSDLPTAGTLGETDPPVRWPPPKPPVEVGDLATRERAARSGVGDAQVLPPGRSSPPRDLAEIDADAEVRPPVRPPRLGVERGVAVHEIRPLQAEHRVGQHHIVPEAPGAGEELRPEEHLHLFRRVAGLDPEPSVEPVAALGPGNLPALLELQVEPTADVGAKVVRSSED